MKKCAECGKQAYQAIHIQPLHGEKIIRYACVFHATAMYAAAVVKYRASASVKLRTLQV